MGPFTYNTDLEWIEGRKGLIKDDELESIEVATPPEFAGGLPGLWSPEHLFVASANVCLMTTFLAIAENSKLDFESYTCKTKGTMQKTNEGVMFTELVHYPKIKVKDEKDIERAERIIQKAEHHCLVTNSMKCAVKIEPEITAK